MGGRTAGRDEKVWPVQRQLWRATTELGDEANAHAGHTKRSRGGSALPCSVPR